jgi:hypothetical protein
MGWAEHVPLRWARRGAYKVLMEITERQLGKPRLRRKDNIKSDIQKIG